MPAGGHERDVSGTVRGHSAVCAMVLPSTAWKHTHFTVEWVGRSTEPAHDTHRARTACSTPSQTAPQDVTQPPPTTGASGSRGGVSTSEQKGKKERGGVSLRDVVVGGFPWALCRGMSAPTPCVKGFTLWGRTSSASGTPPHTPAAPGKGVGGGGGAVHQLNSEGGGPPARAPPGAFLCGRRPEKRGRTRPAAGTHRRAGAAGGPAGGRRSARPPGGARAPRPIAGAIARWGRVGSVVVVVQGNQRPVGEEDGRGRGHGPEARVCPSRRGPPEPRGYAGGPKERRARGLVTYGQKKGQHRGIEGTRAPSVAGGRRAIPGGGGGGRRHNGGKA